MLGTRTAQKKVWRERDDTGNYGTRSVRDKEVRARGGIHAGYLKFEGEMKTHGMELRVELVEEVSG